MKRHGCRLRRKFWILAGLIFAAFIASESNAPAYVLTNVPVIINGYSNAFYYVSGTNGYFRNQQGSSSTTYFWQFANEIQSVEDAYQWTGNPVYLTMTTNLLNGFLTYAGPNWSYDGYNDDDLWATMAFAMGAQLTGKPGYAAIAKTNFDMVYARGWDTNLGGGLYWEYPQNASKNACVNGPGAIAAALLSQIYSDTNYWNKATNIYYWERSVLYTSSSGRVADNIQTNGQVSGGPTTYNQGTFIGAADLLGQTNDAALTATYTMNSMSTAGYLPQYGIGGNNSIFNSIFIRWLGHFMNDSGTRTPYQLWLQNQANAVWNGRRTSDNLSWCQWPEQTPTGTNFYSYDCISGYEAMLAVPPTQTNVTTSVTLTQSDAITTNSFQNGVNWSDGNAPSMASDYLVSGLDLRTPADGANHFFAGNSLTLSNSATLACKNTSGGAGISVGTDLYLDNGEIADWGGNSTTFYGEITLRGGGGRLDPEANSMSITALIGGAGTLTVQAASISQTNGTLTFSGLNTYTGGTVINAAHTVKLSGEGTLGDSGGSLTFSNTAGYGFGAVNLNGGNLTVGDLSGAGGSIYNYSTNLSIFIIGNSNATGGTFAGTINTNIELIKSGSGTLALAGNNNYSGGTIISNGTLLVNNTAGSGTGSAPVRVTGHNAVLGGTGRMTGPLTITNGGNLAPGIAAQGMQTNVIGALMVSGAVSLAGPLVMKINRAATPASDELITPSLSTSSGAMLVVTNTGSTNLMAGDVFTLFNAPVTAAFNPIVLPVLPAPNLRWTNQLAISGTIAVVSLVNSNSTNIVTSLNGGTLTLAWPSDHTGWTLEVQTNSPGTGLGTNWAPVSGSAATNMITVPVVTTNGAVFYRLKL